MATTKELANVLNNNFQKIYCNILTLKHFYTTNEAKQGIAAPLESREGNLCLNTYVPLNLNALERSPGLEDWLGSWAGDFRGREIEILAPEDWLERGGHDFWGSRRNCDNMWIPAYKCGSMVWVPPPGVARFAIEELRQARQQKRQASLHIFVVPRLMGPE